MAITKIPLELTIDDSDGSVTIRLRSPQQEDDDANTIRTHSPQQDDYRPLSVRILEYLRIHPHSTAATIAEALGSTTKDSVSSTLSVLKKEGKVNNGGEGHTTWEWFVT
jgi:DNA-binding transcriptional ArsR family regulator